MIAVSKSEFFITFEEDIKRSYITITFKNYEEIKE